MNSSKKWIFAIVLVLLATNCVFAWGKRDDSGNSNSGSNSSHSLSYTTSSSYGSWIEGATRCNTRSVPAETTWTYSYTFTTEISASAGFSILEIQNTIGAKQGQQETKTGTMKTVLQPLDTVKAMYRPVFTNYSVNSGATYAGSGKVLSDVDIMIYDVYKH